MVSVLVAVYNSEVTLCRCLDSLIAQTYSCLDIVVTDDGSTDKSKEILKAYAERDKRIRVFTTEHGGLAKARNIGLSKAKGEWIAFLDSDDELMPGAIESLLSTAVSADAPIGMGGYYRCQTGKREREIVFEKDILRDEELMRFLFTEGGNHNYLWLRLYKRELFNGIIFPEGMLYEDLFVQPKLALAAGSMAFVKKAVYKYYVSRQSLSGGLDIERQMDGLSAAFYARKTALKAYPELRKYTDGYILETCCWLLGKVTAAGRRRHLKSYKLLVDTFKRAQKTADLSSPLRKLAVLFFRIHPAWLGIACCIYSRIKN